MYQIFFQPFSATEVLKKGSTRSFIFMLLLGSALTALGGLLLMSMPFMSRALAAMSISWTPLTYAQFFLVLFVAAFLMNIVRAFFVHLVMHIFTDKGDYTDALKVMTVNSYLSGVYMLVAIIAAAIPLVGVGLAVLVGTFGILTILAVTIRGLAVLYKTEVVTVWVALSVLIITAIAAMHICLIATGGQRFADGNRMFRFKMMAPYSDTTNVPQV